MDRAPTVAQSDLQPKRQTRTPRSRRTPKAMIQHLQHVFPVLALSAAAVGWVLLALERRANAKLRRELQSAQQKAKKRCVPLQHCSVTMCGAGRLRVMP